MRIKARCMTLLDEEDDVVSFFVLKNHEMFKIGITVTFEIAECNEFIVSKIARSDFPGNWYMNPFSFTLFQN